MAAVLLSLVLIISFQHTYSLQTGKLILLQTPLENGKHVVEITNNRFFINAVVSEQHGLLDCYLSENVGQTRSLLGRPNSVVLDIDSNNIMDMWKRCITKEVEVHGYRTKRTGADGQGIPFTPEKTGKPAGKQLNPAIFPGTKWCGLDNVASSYDDLGEHRETDMCCRDHDHCPYFLDHFQEKYHLRNPYPWTVSHCDCDTNLFNCLKRVNTTASGEVGEMFFGLLNVKCIKFEEGEYCVKEHWTQLWCEQKTTGEKAVLHQFPYKWSDDVVG